jgi:hypothetical protein
MPTLKETRAAIVQRVNTHWQAAYPTVKMYYDNAFPDDAEVDSLQAYVLCSIRFNGGEQMNIAPNPFHRIRGRVMFTAAAREGAGSSKVLEYLDSLVGAMKFAQFGGVTTEQPIVGVPGTAEGWFSYDLSIPFFVDSIN